MSCGTALLLIGQMSLLTYLPLFLKERLAFSTVHASQWLSITQGGAVLGRVGWGTVSDRVFGGRRKIVLVLIGVDVGALVRGVERCSDKGVSPFILVPLTFLRRVHHDRLSGRVLFPDQRDRGTVAGPGWPWA